MKIIRRDIMIYLFFFSLTIPTSSFASDFDVAYSDERTFQSFTDNLFSLILGGKSYANYIEEEYFIYAKDNRDQSDEWRYIGDKKINKKDWEEYFKKKHPPKGEIESKHIWKKWHCYDDDWDDDDWDEWDKKWWDRWH